MKEPIGAVRVLDTSTGADDGVADDADGIVLADDPFMQRFVEVQEFSVRLSSSW